MTARPPTAATETANPPAPTGSGLPSAEQAPSRPPPASGTRRGHGWLDALWRGVHLTGRSLITLSALMVLFVVYQLWGTGLITAREQRELKAEFQERFQATAQTGEVPTAAPEALPGEAVALVEIPSIGAEHAVVEGVGVGDLRKGPGHYPWTPLPGESGNAGIAGHRTTYGAPFNRLDELEPGDEIRVSTLRGRFTYRVTGHEIVGPRQVDVLESDADDRLTLTTCNPEYSARERLVVRARLVGDPIDAPKPPRAPGGRASEPALPDVEAGASLDGPHDSGWAAVDAATLATAVGAALVGGAWWWGFRRRRRWYMRLAGVPPFLVALFFFFVQLEQVLPTSY